MPNVEWGHHPEEEVDTEAETDVEALTETIRGHLEFVYENSESGGLLDEILTLANNNFEKDPNGWTQLLEEIKSSLQSMDEDEVPEALEGYMRKAKLLS